MGAKIERTKWKQFRSLLHKKERKEFDQMYDYFKSNNAASAMLADRSNTRRPYVDYF